MTQPTKDQVFYESFRILNPEEQLNLISSFDASFLKKLLYPVEQPSSVYNQDFPDNKAFFQFIGDMTEEVSIAFLEKIAQSVFNNLLGSLVRHNIKVFYENNKENTNLLGHLIIRDTICANYLTEAEVLIYKDVYRNAFHLRNGLEVKNFLTLLKYNNEILDIVFNQQNENWFKTICNNIKQIPNPDDFLERSIWLDLWLTFRKRILSAPHNGVNLITKTIFQKFIITNMSESETLLYHLIEEDQRHLYSCTHDPIDTNYLRPLFIPYYKAVNEESILSYLFQTKNKKQIHKLKERFIIKDHYYIDGAWLLLTSLFSDIFTNYGHRDDFQKMMLNKHIDSEAFNCSDFRDWFLSFSSCIKMIKDIYGESRLLRLLKNCDWAMDLNTIEKINNELIRLLKNRLATPKILRECKPTSFSEIHDKVFNIVGDHECSTEYITLKQDEKLIAINGFKKDDLKFVIPSNNIQLHRFSVEMRNCVKGYSMKINNEGYKIINVYQNNKAYVTIEIRDFKISEIKGKHNRILDPHEFSLFEQFLREKQLIK